MDDSNEVKITADSIPVRGGSHAKVTFGTAAPEGAELIVEHLCDGQLLEIKTHPEASHVLCALRAGHRSIVRAPFNVDCGAAIEPTGRYFIVIGAMKAGTTTLFHLLAQHPALCRTFAELPGTSTTKEVNYFNKLYRDSDNDLHYDWRFPFDPARHAWTLDVSPNYAKLPRTRPVPRRIATLGGDTKLAYILRDPVDRIESNLAHKLRKMGKLPNLDRCIRMSRYALHLDRFTEYIPREDILLLDFDQLQHDPAAQQARHRFPAGRDPAGRVSRNPSSRRTAASKPLRFQARQRLAAGPVLMPSQSLRPAVTGMTGAPRYSRARYLSFRSS